MKPNLMQCTSKTYPTSFVVTDPKGSILIECGKMLQKFGYRIRFLNTINMKKSMHYNPFAYIHSEKDILKLVTTLIANTKGEGKGGDDFWVKAETLLFTALIGYIHYEAPTEEQNFSTLLEMINAMEVREDDEEFENPVDLMFKELESRQPGHFAVRQYKKYKLAAGKTAKSILISAAARTSIFGIQEVRDLTAYDELELDTLGDRKTALFLIMSDTEDKLTQLVFCDISTPQASPARKVAKALDNPTLHALEDAVPLPELEPAFTVYEDIRQKLIAQGMPAEQIAFIHEANTEVRKKELFSKVRTGQVRVLLGSTQKMGAGTNVQDRLVALHDLDCPWRPGDLAQRKGRIERQGNQNEKVHVFRYVTEGTFDAYLWQTVENKQKFISQIMSSKSPVRSCDDVDETALSFAEIKALCAGDPRIKERMDLDVDVSRLKLMKADHQSKQYQMEDNLLKYFPEQIEKHKGFIKGLEADMETLAAHPHPEDSFAGMEVRGDMQKRGKYMLPIAKPDIQKSFAPSMRRTSFYTRQQRKHLMSWG